LLCLVFFLPCRAQSLLVLGKPGTGKTTLLRDIARIMSTPPQQGGLGLAVLIVHTSNEIAGGAPQLGAPPISFTTNSAQIRPVHVKPSSYLSSWQSSSLKPLKVHAHNCQLCVMRLTAATLAAYAQVMLTSATPASAMHAA
jgi:energy-coupling factor transporter ATP-binding protein EcfA2